MRAQCQRGDPCPDGRCRPTAAATGRVGRIVRIAGGAWTKVGKLSGDGFTQNERASLPQCCHAGGFAALQKASGQLAACLCGEAIDLKNIFYPQRNTKQGRPFCRIGILFQELLSLLLQAWETAVFRHKSQHVWLTFIKTLLQLGQILHQGPATAAQFTGNNGQ